MSNAIPAEVWTIILSYSHDINGSLADSGSLTLLSRAFKHALSERYFSLIEETVQQGVLRLPWNDGAVLQSIRLQKRVLLALGNVPGEVLAGIRSLEGNFFGRQQSASSLLRNQSATVGVPREDHSACLKWHRIVMEGALARLPLLESIVCPQFFNCGNMSKQQNPTSECSWVCCLDFSELHVLHHIDDAFLQNCGLMSLKLPKSLRTLGNDAFLSVWNLSHVDLSGTEVTTIGAFFAKSSCIQAIAFPKTLQTIGDYALKNTNQLKHLDLSHTQLMRIPQGFLSDSAIEDINFPFALAEIDSQAFKNATKLKRLDLSHTQVKKIGHRFAEDCVVLSEVSFPSTLQSIGDSVFQHTLSLTEIDLSPTSVVNIGFCFALKSAVRRVFLPETLKIIGSCAFCGIPLEVIGCPVISTNERSASADDGQEKDCWANTKPRAGLNLMSPEISLLHFPSSLQQLDSAFQSCKFLKRIDLSRSLQLTTLEKHFAAGSAIEELLVPPTLTLIEDRVLVSTTKLQHLDLSATAVKDISGYFAVGSGLCTILFPSVLESIGEFAFQNVRNLKALDFSGTKLTYIGSHFGAGSGLEEIMLSSTIVTIDPCAFAEAKNMKKIDVPKSTASVPS
jgi:Leucine-rich repeat (LRR) protein